MKSKQQRNTFIYISAPLPEGNILDDCRLAAEGVTEVLTFEVLECLPECWCEAMKHCADVIRCHPYKRQNRILYDGLCEKVDLIDLTTQENGEVSRVFERCGCDECLRHRTKARVPDHSDQQID